MPTISSIVDAVHPTISGVGVILSDQIWVLFDREIDETVLQAGNFFVTGPDFDTWSGPDLQLYTDYESMGSEEEILTSPGYHGVVQGAFTFEKVSLTDDDTTVSGTDTLASGIIYRTKAIFTPTERLASDTTYTVYLTGDEDSTDSLNTGICTRTVFDAESTAGNATTGTVTFTGGYTGSIDDVFNVEIVASGVTGSATFQYWKSTTPGTVVGPLKTRRGGTTLSNGVSVSFSETTWGVGDSWTCIVEARDIFTGNLIWPFTTGSGSIAEVPEEAATSVIGDTVSTTSTSSSSSTLSVSSTTPADNASHQSIPGDGEVDISIIFDDTLDSSTVVSGVTVTVTAEGVNGDEDLLTSGVAAVSGVCIAKPTVTGSQIDIVVASGELTTNNLVTITLDSTIASESGATLGSDYSFSFTTTYSPYYCTLRKQRLEVGTFISDVADDTINLAIFEASLAADALTWGSTTTSSAVTSYYNFVRAQWTCCKAQEILLINTTGGSNNLKSKELGDLRVEYQTGTNDALNRALACLERWEGALQAGGAQVQGPAMVVKGANDPDRPPAGRVWYKKDGMPVANTRYKNTNYRRYRHTYYQRYKGQ